MRHIEVEDGLRLRFSGRNEEFNEGVEIGLLVARLARGDQSFSCQISTANVDQARAVAQQLGYRMCVMSEHQSMSEVQVAVRSRRPALTLVSDSRRTA